ncbi:MAG: glycosyltransferase [Candidatus Omnitrophica bacterium]|nr:glycosyltransferase [Candidatus Omnitrophota bacterium]
MQPLVTVLMTVFNAESYLEKTLGSVLNQTYPHFELLIIDDCSSDRSLTIIKSFQDPRIRFHRNERNQGQTKSLNVGLRLAQGKYIARMDADDLAFPMWLEDQLRFIESHPEYAVVSTKAVVIDSQHKINKPLRSYSDSRDIFLRALVHSPINHVGCLMQKNIIIENGGYDENFKIAADYELWSILLRRGFKLTSTVKTLVAIRVHERSISILERGQADVREISEIMHRNIKAFTTLPLEKDEVLLVWKLIYAAENLNMQQFFQANEFLTQIYSHLRNTKTISSSYAKRFLKKEQFFLYLKKVFSSSPHFLHIVRKSLARTKIGKRQL